MGVYMGVCYSESGPYKSEIYSIPSKNVHYSVNLNLNHGSNKGNKRLGQFIKNICDLHLTNFRCVAV